MSAALPGGYVAWKSAGFPTEFPSSAMTRPDVVDKAERETDGLNNNVKGLAETP